MTTAVDTLDILGVTLALPEQAEAAKATAIATQGLPSADGVTSIVVFGMGGSGIAGDVLKAIAGPVVGVPVVVSKGYECPEFVGPNTLVFACSFSGDTEETVEAATAAQAAGARMIVLTRGGKLGALAKLWNVAHVPMPSDLSMPRTAIGALGIPPIVLLDRMGMLPGGIKQVDQAITQLKARRDALVTGQAAGTDPVSKVAAAIGSTLPEFHGGGLIGEAAAYRAVCQVRENPKCPSFFAAQPELCHNELAGWGVHGDLTRQAITLVQLRHDFEHPQVSRRHEYIGEQYRELLHDVVVLSAEGEGPLAQLMDLVIQVDLLSVNMSYALGVDPGPIPTLIALKNFLVAN